MRREIITDNAGEQIYIQDDEERLSLVKVSKVNPISPIKNQAIILNARELKVAYEFIKTSVLLKEA